MWARKSALELRVEAIMERVGQAGDNHRPAAQVGTIATPLSVTAGGCLTAAAAQTTPRRPLGLVTAPLPAPRFLPHAQVPKVMEHVRDVLRDVKWLRTSSLPTAKQTLPVLYNIVNTAHPFREGNGRTQRQFFQDLATGAGFKIDWTSIPKAVNDRASEMARGGDDVLMKAMFDVIVSETPERAARSAGLAGFTRPRPRCLDALRIVG